MKEKRIPTALNSSTAIDEKYMAACPERGEVRVVGYGTRDYVPDIVTSGNAIAKTARVYLPYGYDKSKVYNVVYTLHGVGGDDANDWLNENSPNPATVIDNLIYYGDIAPCIVVFPNGRSTTAFDTRKDSTGYWYFGKELRNDLIPFIERNFAVGRARENRALCGLSMGGCQVSQIGILENYDLFAYYGIFSSTLHHINPYFYNTAEKTAGHINQNKLPMNYLFFCSGTADEFVYPDLISDLKTFDANISTEKVEKGRNYSVVFVPEGKHDYVVWQVALYDYLQLIF